MTLVFYKPYGVLTKFTDQEGRLTLAAYVDVPGVYPAGRLDQDSEGLLVLTDDGALQHRLSSPRYGKEKGYWAQVEREPNEEALAQLRRGLVLKDGPTLPAVVRRIEPPELPEREPPVRFRKTVPTAWIDLRIREGRNRQVRRMTAAVGFPTLRLVRYQVGPWTLEGLQPGEWRVVG
ncbi:MAG: pseudouridine synthase [Deltaproteobacteria bacterium]|nr:pseudouridine synthase [Deltaproteobacteria bacterium]